MQVLLATCGSWYLRETAKAFQSRDSLAGLCISDKNSTGIHPERFHRCWPYHFFLKPFLHAAPQIIREKAFYALSPIWRSWLRGRLRRPFTQRPDAVQAIMGFGREVFDFAESIQALKVIDCCNSHPNYYAAAWQAECDRWKPGEKIPIPDSFLAAIREDITRADLVLCPSNFVRDTMVQNGVPSDRCFIHPFGVNTRLFKKRPEAPSKPTFVSVGTLCVRKGHPYLMRAMQKVRETFPEAELICVGDIKTDFAPEARKWKGTFTHHHNLSHAALAQRLSQCSTFVLASVEEGFARVLTEAMAVGLPLVATYETGASTLVTEGKEGFIVASRNVESLATAMLQTVATRANNQQMGDAAYLKVQSHGDWQSYGDVLLEAYEKRVSTRK